MSSPITTLLLVMLTTLSIVLGGLSHIIHKGYVLPSVLGILITTIIIYQLGYSVSRTIFHLLVSIALTVFCTYFFKKYLTTRV